MTLNPPQCRNLEFSKFTYSILNSTHSRSISEFSIFKRYPEQQCWTWAKRYKRRHRQLRNKEKLKFWSVSKCVTIDLFSENIKISQLFHVTRLAWDFINWLYLWTVKLPSGAIYHDCLTETLYIRHFDTEKLSFSTNLIQKIKRIKT